MRLTLSRFLSNRVRTFSASEVTTRSTEEVEPWKLGMQDHDVEAIWSAVTRYYAMGLQPAMALCIRRRGEILIDRAIGHARGNAPGEDGPAIPATPNTLFNLFSGSKSITAMLIAHLDAQHELQLDHPVAHYIPAFAQGGKENITIRHILTHRAGIPAVPEDTVSLDILTDRERMLDIMCKAEPMTAAGHQLAYHAITGGFVLGELVHRVTGEDIRSFLGRVVRGPLGFENLNFGVASDRISEVAEEAFTGPEPRQPFSRLLETSLGMDIRDIVQLANDPRFLTGIVPSGNIIGTANEISRYFELLLRGGELDGVRVFSQRTVRRAIAPQSTAEIDRIIMLPVQYGMGFMLGGERLSFYGGRTPRAFGHLGFTNVLAWADPERDISVALMNNGKPFVTPELLLWLNIPRVISARVPRDAKLD